MNSPIALINPVEQDVGDFFFIIGKVHVQAWDVWQFGLASFLNCEWKAIIIP